MLIVAYVSLWLVFNYKVTLKAFYDIFMCILLFKNSNDKIFKFIKKKLKQYSKKDRWNKFTILLHLVEIK